MDQVYVVRLKVRVEGLSARKVAKELGISRNTVKRYVEGAEPGDRQPVARPGPALDGVRARRGGLLTEPPRWTGGKQRLTATQLHRMVVAEGHRVGVTEVKELVAEWRRQRKEAFVPLVYCPGDLGAALHVFEPCFARPRTGHDKGGVEGRGKGVRWESRHRLRHADRRERSGYQPPSTFTGKLNGVSLPIDRPKLTPEDVKRLEEAEETAADQR